VHLKTLLVHIVSGDASGLLRLIAHGAGEVIHKVED
jgi:hypothetical protein